MKKNFYYKQIIPFYNKVVENFLSLISNFNVKIYKINDYEKVIEIENSTIYFLGLNEIYHSQKQMDQMYDFLDHNVTMLNLASYGKKYKDFLRNNLKYIIVDKTIKSLDEVNITAKSILNNAYTYYYDNFEKGSLVLPPTKWKSEYQVKELCEKLFGKNNVIYQYKPFLSFG